jgi:hypothetical protein
MPTKSSKVKVDGYCPLCGAPGVWRKLLPNPHDRCAAGHYYPTCNRITEQ